MVPSITTIENACLSLKKFRSLAFKILRQHRKMMKKRVNRIRVNQIHARIDAINAVLAISAQPILNKDTDA